MCCAWVGLSKMIPPPPETDFPRFLWFPCLCLWCIISNLLLQPQQNLIEICMDGLYQEPDDGSMKGLAFAYDPDGYWVEIIKRGGIDFGDKRKDI